MELVSEELQDLFGSKGDQALGQLCGIVVLEELRLG